MPRSVPRLKLYDMLAWVIVFSSPCAASSFWQKARAKKPRSSLRGSSSITYAPRSGVSVNFMAASSSDPHQRIVETALLQQMQQLLQARELAAVEPRVVQLEAPERLVQLGDALLH